MTGGADDPRIRGILDQLERLVAGDLSARSAITDAGDGLDAIAAGLNRLVDRLAIHSHERRAAAMSGHGGEVPSADAEPVSGAPSTAPEAGHEAILQAVRTSEQRYRHLWENLRDAAFLADAETGELIETNPRGEALIGLPREGIVGQPQSMLHPPDFPGSDTFRQHVASEGMLYDVPVQRADGTVLLADVAASVMTINDRRVVLGLFRDVTDRHRMTEALRASESRYRLLWDNLNDAGFIADAASGEIVDVNCAAERLLGRPRETIVGHSHTELHPPEHAAQYAAQFLANAGESRRTVDDIEVLRADGTRVSVDISATSMEIAGRRMVLGLFHDISRRKATLRQLQFMQTAVEQAGDAIFWIDDRLRFVHVNDSACQRLGYERSELLSMSVGDVAPHFQQLAPDFGEIRNRSRVTFQSEHRRKDGTTFPVEVTSAWFCYEGRDYICSIARDISERVAAERVILERDANLLALAENANDGIVVGRGDSHLFINRRFAEMLGYRLDEVAAIRRLALVHPDDRARAAELMRSRDSGADVPTQYEIQLLCKNGSALPVEITAARTTWDGEPAHLIVVRDITNRQKADQALKRQSEDLAKVNLELEQLLYVMAHDLKAPLRAVSQLTSVLESELAELDEEARRLFDLLQGRVQRMHALIESLLMYTRAGGEPAIDAVDCRALVEEIASDLDIPVGFTIDIAADLPIFLTDRLQLRQVLANLIDNAIEHHDRSDGRVAVNCNDLGASWEFLVSDDGPGVPPAYHDSIFRIFHTLQLDDRKPAAGVGLALVKKLVEGHGGRVGIESEGRGCTFRFTWPKVAVPTHREP